MPIKTLPFLVPPVLEQETLKQLNEMLEAGIITRSNSSWSCPMLLVKKKRTDPSKPQTFRLALDLRLLNAIIIPSSYPLPKIQNLLTNLSKHKYFTTLDLPSAYWQISLPENLQDKVSFTTPWGVFTYRRLVFGLRTASATFQHCIDSVIQQAQIESCYAYQDDIVVGADSFQEMYDKLSKLLDAFIKNNLTLNPEKCTFFHNKIDFLGFHVEDHKVLPINSNIKKITAFARPKTKKQVKGFIGLCSFYRSLIPAFAQLVSPLIQLTKPKVKFTWQDIHEEAFQQLQSIFFQKPMLNLPNWDKKFYINTDASKTAIAAALMQKQDNELLPISYFSKVLSDAEKKYPPIKLELYALYKAITSFKYYLFGRHFYVLSDAKALDKYKRSSSPTDIITRWLMELSEFSFSFIHVPGKENVLADYLSRSAEPPTEDLSSNPDIINSDKALPVVNNSNDLHQEIVSQFQAATSDNAFGASVVPKVNKQISQNEFQINHISQTNTSTPDPLLEISDKTIFNEQRKDKILKKIIDDLQLNHTSNKLKGYYINPENNLLCFNNFLDPEQIELHRAVLPEVLVFKALSIAHITHTGINKTLQNLRKRFTWKTIIADTQNFVKSCEICLIHKHHKVNKAPFLPAPAPTGPNQKISLDLVGPLKNNTYVLTVLDHFSRHLELFTLNNITAQTVTKALLHYISTHGRPEMILTDQGSQFTSYMFDAFNKALGIKLKHITIAHPQANGLSERVNTQIKSSLYTMATQGFDLSTAAKIHQSIYNATTHPATKFSPNLLHFGRELNDVYANYKGHSSWKILDTAHDIFKLVDLLENIYYQAYINNETNRQKIYQKSRQQFKFSNIKVNDTVYIKFPNNFKRKIDGPFNVQKIISPVLIQIMSLKNKDSSPMLIHTNRVMKLHPRNLQKFQQENDSMSSSSDKNDKIQENKQDKTPNSNKVINGVLSSHPYNLRSKRN